jgi:phosphoesterase RecJ-like protein
MELSPKQQEVEQIKKANKILILGHQTPEGDFLGSALALSAALKSLGKSAEVVVSDNIPATYQYLPNLNEIKDSLNLTKGKVLRINTKDYPIHGMQYQKHDDFLDIILDSEKNLKFQFVEIINGLPKPDLIIVLDTADVEKIDSAYDKNTELFFEVPVINIDHHAGNEYFGQVNLVDLTATSTAEILVSLFEALGVKISDPDMATMLLTGIISDTASFRSANTTPKSLTVAAQLLAAGGRQQEIITNLYKKRPMALLKLWGEMLAGISLDASHRFAWTKVKMAEMQNMGIEASDVFDAADELLLNTPDADTILILCEVGKGKVKAKLKGSKESNVLPLAEIFGGSGTSLSANFEVEGDELDTIELNILKKIHDFWGDKGQNEEKAVWEILAGPQEELTVPTTQEEIEETIEEKLSTPETKKEVEEVTPEPLSAPVTEIEKEATETPKETKESKTTTPPKHPLETIREIRESWDLSTSDGKDPIDDAIASIEKEQEKGGFSKIGDVIKKKRNYLHSDDEVIDIFDEDNY